MFDIEYGEKIYEIAMVEATYSNYYLLAKLEPDNKEAFINTVKQITSYNEHDFKESYKGMSGIVPVDVVEREEGFFGRFRLDMWMPDENKEIYEASER